MKPPYNCKLCLNVSVSLTYTVKNGCFPFDTFGFASYAYNFIFEQLLSMLSKQQK